MDNYYVECRITYVDKTEEEPYEGAEGYQFIIPAKTLSSAMQKAIVKTMRSFKEEFDCDFDDVHCIIDTIYKTTDDARV